jgi:hypothetical protein
LLVGVTRSSTHVTNLIFHISLMEDEGLVFTAETKLHHNHNRYSAKDPLALFCFLKPTGAAYTQAMVECSGLRSRLPNGNPFGTLVDLSQNQGL